MRFLDMLEEVLKKDERFIGEDGRLIKATIYDAAMRTDELLLELLMGNPMLREHFFVDVKGTLVFDKVKFTWVVESKEFLPDSYTLFKNRIGLADSDGRLLSQQNNVTLIWPYKDCILQGGQTKEEQKQDEIFFNETLAPDETTRLLYPKVFTNARRHNRHGVEGVTSINYTDNLIIKGNNLLALTSLLRRFEGKIQCIYIDPPYNTGSDSFKYNDSFNHSSWLTFMRNRISMAARLLKNSGIIYISVDDNEAAYLKVLCDEIFGRENYLATIAYERSGVSGLGQGGRFLVNTHESIICFAKDKQQMITNDLSGEFEFGHEEMKRYNKILVSDGKSKEIARFTAPSTGEEVIIRKHHDYDIETISLRDFKNRKGEIEAQYLLSYDNVFRNTSVQAENEFQNRILGYCGEGLYSAEYTVSRGRNQGKRIVAHYYNNQVFAWLKDSASLIDGVIVKTNKLSDFWDHASIPKADLANEGGVSLRRGKKPENLLKRIIQMSTKKGDIVMDFFLGSGTTAAVAHKMGIQYIGVEQLDYGDNDSTNRLLNVINGEQSGISRTVNWQGGGSFVYCELKERNEAIVSKLQAADNTEDVLTILNQITDEGLIIPSVLPAELRSHMGRIDELPLEHQKQLVMELVDKNRLYVNLCDIDDEEVCVSEQDKAFTRSFYGLSEKGGE